MRYSAYALLFCYAPQLIGPVDSAPAVDTETIIKTDRAEALPVRGTV